MAYSTTTTVIGSATVNQAANLPATVDANDALIVVYSWLGAATNNIATPPAGFTQVMAQVNRSDIANLAIYAKVAAGTEDGGTATAVVDSATVGTAIVVRIPAAEWFKNLSGIEIGTAAVQINISPNVPPVTASWGAEDNLFIAVGALADDSASFTAAPTNYTDLVSVESATGTNSSCSCGAAFRALTAASDDPDNFTLSESEAYVTNTLVVRPAAEPAGGIVIEETGSNFANTGTTVDIENFNVAGAANRQIIAFTGDESDPTAEEVVDSVTLDPGGGDEVTFDYLGVFAHCPDSICVNIQAWRLKDADIPASGTYTIRADSGTDSGPLSLIAIMASGLGQGAVVDTDHFTGETDTTVGGTVTTAADDALLVNCAMANIASSYTHYANGTEFADVATGGVEHTIAGSYEIRATAGGATVSATVAATPARQSLVSIEFAAFVAPSGGANDNRRGIARGVARGIARGI
jgi:hypothetical protein